MVCQIKLCKNVKDQIDNLNLKYKKQNNWLFLLQNLHFNTWLRYFQFAKAWSNWTFFALFIPAPVEESIPQSHSDCDSD